MVILPNIVQVSGFQILDLVDPLPGQQDFLEIDQGDQGKGLTEINIGLVWANFEVRVTKKIIWSPFFLWKYDDKRDIVFDFVYLLWDKPNLGPKPRSFH
jgi:hypothetical protein